MSAKLIDGVAIAKTIRSECRERVQAITRRHGVTPGLAIILVGSNPASRVHVKNKVRACEDVGICSFRFEYGEDVAAEIVLDKIRALNADTAIHGILVQLPLPPQFNITEVLHAIR